MRGFDFLLVGRFFDFYDHFLKVEIFKIKINHSHSHPLLKILTKGTQSHKRGPAPSTFRDFSPFLSLHSNPHSPQNTTTKEHVLLHFHTLKKSLSHSLTLPLKLSIKLSIKIYIYIYLLGFVIEGLESN